MADMLYTNSDMSILSSCVAGRPYKSLGGVCDTLVRYVKFAEKVVRVNTTFVRRIERVRRQYL